MPETETITVDATSTTTQPVTTPRDEPLGDAGKLALQKERDDRKAAEKRAKDAEDRLAQIDAERTKADEETAKANGEFERLAGDRLTKLEKAEAEAKDHKARADRATELLSKQIATRRDALHDDVKVKFPEDADPLDQVAWLDSPATVGWDTALKGTTQTVAGIPGTPRPTGALTKDQQAAQATKRLAESGQYSIA